LIDVCTSLGQSVFPAHWCAGYSKTYGFLAGGISKSPPHSPRGFAASSGSTAKTLFRVRLYNTASYAGYVEIITVITNNNNNNNNNNKVIQTKGRGGREKTQKHSKN